MLNQSNHAYDLQHNRLALDFLTFILPSDQFLWRPQQIGAHPGELIQKIPSWDVVGISISLRFHILRTHQHVTWEKLHQQCACFASNFPSHMKYVMSLQECPICSKSTLLSRAIWKPANSLKLMSAKRRGPSPVIPCSNCLKSRRWARERELEWFFTFMPVSWGAFFPTDTIRRSDSIFALIPTNQGEKLHILQMSAQMLQFRLKRGFGQEKQRYNKAFHFSVF